jgi:L-alanine-DL-glutamate epimerase-like enolase superfamily enzyme
VHELSLHVAAALPNAFLVEYMEWMPEDLFESLPAFQGGAIVIPDRPGHGLAFNAKAVEKYRIR